MQAFIYFMFPAGGVFFCSEDDKDERKKFGAIDFQVPLPREEILLQVNRIFINILSIG